MIYHRLRNRFFILKKNNIYAIRIHKTDKKYAIYRSILCIHCMHSKFELQTCSIEQEKKRKLERV